MTFVTLVLYFWKYFRQLGFREMNLVQDFELCKSKSGTEGARMGPLCQHRKRKLEDGYQCINIKKADSILESKKLVKYACLHWKLVEMITPH